MLKKCNEQLKTFSPGIEKNSYVDEPTLPIMPWIQPKTLAEMGEGLQVWHEKLKKGQKRLEKGKPIWSDPARPEHLELFIDTSQSLCTEGGFSDMELSIF